MCARLYPALPTNKQYRHFRFALQSCRDFTLMKICTLVNTHIQSQPKSLFMILDQWASAHLTSLFGCFKES